MFATPEDRWDRIATVLGWTAGLFVLFAAYGIYDGDDWRGIVMTVLPGAVVAGFAYLAARRRDHLIDGTPHTLGERIAMIAALVVVGGYAGLWILTTGEAADRAELVIPIPKDVKMCVRDITLANGQTASVPTLCRR